MTSKGCWYMTYTRECVLCGAGDTTRVRMWTEKPADPRDRFSFEQFACMGHFL